jgi:hypothetical protein
LAGFAQHLFAWADVPEKANRKTTNTTPANFRIMIPRKSDLIRSLFRDGPHHREESMWIQGHKFDPAQPPAEFISVEAVILHYDSQRAKERAPHRVHLGGGYDSALPGRPSGERSGFPEFGHRREERRVAVVATKLANSTCQVKNHLLHRDELGGGGADWLLSM